MSDLLGALAIPIPVPAPGDTVADPFLDYLGAFLQAAINADARAAWAAVHPATIKPHSSPVPVVTVKTHNPEEADFRSGDLPALFVYRASSGRRVQTAQDLTIVPTTVHLLWAPPRAQQKTLSLRQPFRHAIEASIDRCLGSGRDPAWVVEGDTDPSAAEYGSYFYTYAKLFGRPEVVSAQDYPLRLQMEDGSPGVDEFDCFLITIEIKEILQPDPLRRGVPHLKNNGAIRIGKDPTDLLTTQAFEFNLALDSLAPTTGPIAGGTTVTLTGKQFVEVMEVYFGTKLAADFTFVDEQTVTVKTPAHAAGIVDVTVRTPSDEATRTAAFTFTA